MRDEVFFREEQRFPREWVWLIVLTTGVPLVMIFGWGLWQQIVRGVPFGNQPMSDGGLIAVASLSIGGIAAIVWLFLAASLVTEVREDGLWIRFRPFHRKAFAIGPVVAVEARRYRPIVEYGGWGIRYGWKEPGARAYNVAGNEGVEVTLAGGTKIMIGSQRPAELKAALDRALAAG